MQAQIGPPTHPGHWVDAVAVSLWQEIMAGVTDDLDLWLGEDMLGSEAESADKMETTVEARNTVGENDQWQHPITGTRTRVEANLGIDPWKCNCCGTWNPKESGACSNALQWQGSNRNAMPKKQVTLPSYLLLFEQCGVRNV